MSSAGHRMYSIEIDSHHASDAGIYTWDIEKNTFFADRAMAALFGIEPARAARGLPIETYLERVHPDDRPDLAKIISATIIAEIAQQNSYRVQGSCGNYNVVVAFGKAFRNSDGTPVLYSGIVVPAAAEGHITAPCH